MILFNAPDRILPITTKRAVKMAVEMRDTIGLPDPEVAQRGHSLGFGVGNRAWLCDAGPDRLRAAAESPRSESVTTSPRGCATKPRQQIVVSRRVFGMSSLGRRQIARRAAS